MYFEFMVLSLEKFSGLRVSGFGGLHVPLSQQRVICNPWHEPLCLELLRVQPHM